MTYNSQTNTTPSEKAPDKVEVSFNGTNSDGNTVSIAGGDSVKP